MKKMSSMDHMHNMPMPDLGPITNTPEQHAFIMAGVQTLFLCHMTMLHMENHMYELVLQGSLPPYAQQQYVADCAKHPKSTYFLGNVEQDLMTLPDLHIGSRVSFIADIWRDIPPKHHYHVWPWKDEKPFISNVRVQVDRVVRIRHYNLAQPYPDSMTYFMFGSGTEAHLYHYQTRQPDFDQVISLAEVPSFIPAPQLRSGVLVNIPGMPSNPPPCSNPLSKKVYLVEYEGISQLGRHEIKIGRNLWFSTKITNEKNPCPDE